MWQICSIQWCSCSVELCRNHPEHISLGHFCSYCTRYCSNSDNLKFEILAFGDILNTFVEHWKFPSGWCTFLKIINRFSTYEFHQIKLKKFDKSLQGCCILQLGLIEKCSLCLKHAISRWFPHSWNRLKNKPQILYFSVIFRQKLECWFTNILALAGCEVLIYMNSFNCSRNCIPIL